MLYKVFVDDSGSKDYKTPYTRDFVDNPPPLKGNEEFWRSNYFALCGVRVKQTEIGVIDGEISELKKNCFGTHKVEIKSTWMRIPDKRKKYYLDPYGIDAEALNKFGEDYIDLIARHADKMKLIGVVFDKRYYGDQKRNAGDGNPLLKTVQVLMEKVQYAGNINIITFDQFESSLSVDKGHHNRVMGIFRNNDGVETSFTDEYDNIADIEFKKSCDENFLQVADICAYNIHRQFVEFGREWCGENETDGKTTLSTYPYFERLRCNFHADIKGQVRGVGLTCIPTVKKVNWGFLNNCPT